jgi:hypothetical protein
MKTNLLRNIRKTRKNHFLNLWGSLKHEANHYASGQD